MATPLRVRDMLRAHGVPFVELHHPEALTAQEVAQREHFSGHHVAKVVVALADGRLVELILPASRRADLDRVRTALAARTVRLASEAEMAKAFADSEVGAVPALPHGKEVGVLMDRSLYVEGDILFQAGTHTDAVRLNFWDWFEMVKPHVATFSVPADAAHV